MGSVGMLIASSNARNSSSFLGRPAFGGAERLVVLLAGPWLDWPGPHRIRVIN